MSIKSKNSIMAMVTNYALFEIFILGILSGMPFSILYTQLVLMMKELGVPLATVTLLAFAKMPFAWKFLWSPLIDGFNLPFFRKFGRRKGWMMFTTMINIALVICFGVFASKDNFLVIGSIACLFGFMSASYDIAYDAWRIERIDPDLQTTGATLAVYGWRIGAVFITSAGMLYVVGGTGSWHIGFFAVAAIYLASFLFLLTVTDASSKETKKYTFDLKKNVIEPFKDFLTKPNAVAILFAITFYKAGEAMIGYVSLPFYTELGFTKIEIANIAKAFGFWATMFGMAAGALICYKLGSMRGLLVCGIVQMCANLTFLWLETQGAKISALFITITIDNFSGGMGMAALVGYLSTLCNREYTATQYALFSSLTTFANNTIIAGSGALVTNVGWSNFFIFCTCLSFPALLILIYLIQEGRR